MMKNALVVIAKRPLPGQTKTHLTPPLLPVQAAELYECFLRDTLDVARQVPDMTRLIAYAPLDAKKIISRNLRPTMCSFPKSAMIWVRDSITP